MKSQTALIAVLLGLSSPLLLAQETTPSAPPAPGGQRGSGGPGQIGQRGPSPIIAALDLNSDGTIDAAELAKASESLKKLDKNGDGKISEDEFRPQRGPGQAGPGAQGQVGQRGPGAPSQRGPGGQTNRPQGGAPGTASEAPPAQ